MTTREENSSPLALYVASRVRVALGTFVAVEVEAESPAIAQKGIAAALDAISIVEGLMHPHRPGSDLAAIATCETHATVSVHAWTWEVLELSRQLHAASEGLFDPCLADAPGRLGDLELLESGRVRPSVRMRLDLGGIAKGYAVDRALEALRLAGCQGALVNAGGDLGVFGASSRNILCRSAAGCAWVELKDAALASSDAEESNRPREHRGYYDGADRTRVVLGRATVTARCAALADALATCALLCDGSRSEALLQKFGARRIRTQARYPDRSE